MNDAITGDPSLVNSDPEGKGWFFRMKIANQAELNELMDEDAYKAFLATLE